MCLWTVTWRHLCRDGHHIPQRNYGCKHDMTAEGRACDGWRVAGCTAGHVPVYLHPTQAPVSVLNVAAFAATSETETRGGGAPAAVRQCALWVFASDRNANEFSC